MLGLQERNLPVTARRLEQVRSHQADRRDQMHDTAHPKRLLRSRRARLLAALALVAGVLVAGWGGGSNSPSVANVDSTATSTSSTATTPAHGSAAQFLVEWADCMRRHGDPN